MSSLITWLSRTGKQTKREPEGIITTEQRESQSKQHQEQYWGRADVWTAASSSPLQQIWAVLSLQTVRHTAPALLVVVDHLDLCATQTDNITQKKKNRKSLIRETRDNKRVFWIDCSCDNGRKWTQQNQNVFFPYFSGVGALPGCSLPRQGKVECELQTIPCKKKKKARSSVLQQQLIKVHESKSTHSIFPYALMRRWLIETPTLNQKQSRFHALKGIFLPCLFLCNLHKH